MLPPPQDRAERGKGGNPLRDFMLKSHDNDPQVPQAGLSREPRYDGHPSHESPVFPSSPFHGWTPFSKVKNIFAPTCIFISRLCCCGNMKCYYCLLCTVSTFLCFSNGLMIFGRRGHRKLRRRSAKKTEVGGIFNPLVREMKYMIWPRVPTDFPHSHPVQIWTLQCPLEVWIRFWRHLLVRCRTSPGPDHSSNRSLSPRWWNLMGWEKRFILI